MAVGKGLTRLSTSSPCSTSLRTCDTIRCLAASRSCSRALASRTHIWYSAMASCTWGDQARAHVGQSVGPGELQLWRGHGARSPPWPGPPLEIAAAAPAVCWALGKPGVPGPPETPGSEPTGPRCAVHTGAGPSAAPALRHSGAVGGGGRNRRGQISTSSSLLPAQQGCTHPPCQGLTIRFCSFVHCSLNSFRHFSISVRLAARGWQGGQMGVGGLPQGHTRSLCSPLPRAFYPLDPLGGLHSPPPSSSPPHPF